MKNTIDQLREKLKWFTYEATYTDYNEQEVNYIIEQLETHDKKQEDIINSCCITIPLEQTKHKSEPKKKVNHRITVAVTSIVAVAASVLLFMFQQTEVMAALKKGIFNFISKDDSGMSIIIYPEQSTKVKIYDSLKVLPAELENILWFPKDTLYTYTFSYIVEDEDRIVQRYDNKKQDTYAEIGYILSSENPNYDGNVNLQIQYGNIPILFYTIDSADLDEKYRRTFFYKDTNYYIESNSIDDVNIAIYEFIEYIIAK